MAADLVRNALTQRNADDGDHSLVDTIRKAREIVTGHNALTARFSERGFSRSAATPAAPNQPESRSQFDDRRAVSSQSTGPVSLESVR